jgi:hypothetical protein
MNYKNHSEKLNIDQSIKSLYLLTTT